MFYNYLKIALRNLLKNKAFTAITVLGLSAGTTCFILIYMFVQNELSYDKFHEKNDRLFRVLIKKEFPASGSAYGGERELNAFMRPELLDEVKDSNKSIVGATRYQSVSSWNWVEYEEKTRIDAMAFVDPDYLQMFDFPLLAGDPETALYEPNQMIITEGLAAFLFGDYSHDYSQLIGRVVTLPASERKDFIVSGVMKDPPGNSTMQFSLLVQYENWRGMGSSNNEYGRCLFFLELDSPHSVKETEQSIGPIFLTAYSGLIERLRERGRLSRNDPPLRCVLQPLSEMYLSPDIVSGYLLFSFKTFSIILSAIAILILLIACINAVTIQLGQVTVRAREVGIRKVVGANRFQLITQFYLEAGILCFLSLLLGILFTELLTPAFNEMADFSIGWTNPNADSLSLSLFKSHGAIYFLLSSFFATTLIIGGFPSVVMSDFNPLAVLRFQNSARGRGLFTSGLVIAQFAITVILFFCTIVGQRQVDFIREKDLGFQKEGVMVLRMPSDFEDPKKPALKNRLQQIPSALSVAAADRNFNSGSSTGSVTNRYNELLSVGTLRIDEDYLETLNIQLLEGRNFSEEMTTDRGNAVLVNQEMVDRSYWEDPIGQTFRFWGRELTVIGVVENFHYRSIHEEMGPLCLNMWPNMGNSIDYFFIRYDTLKTRETMDAIGAVWKEFEAYKPMDLSFLDEIIQQQYVYEERFNGLNFSGSAIAIILSCMGLWGITSLAVARRTKEIGIRKVMGSSEMGIWKLFSADIAKLFCFSLFVAVPIGWIVMKAWLEMFYVYHIELPWFVFVQAGVSCIAIAFVTVSWLVIRAALNNPVKSLRYE